MDEERILSAVQAVLDGDGNAFEDIVRTYEKNVYNIALRMTGDREDALDISQEAFLKAYHSLPSFRGEGKFSVWLYRIVSNTCLDFLRSRSRRNEVSLSEALQRGLLRLPEDQRKILLLREIEGLSYDEIARVLSIEGGTVKSRIYRARRKLCEFLAGDGNISPSASSNKTGGGDMP